MKEMLMMTKESKEKILRRLKRLKTTGNASTFSAR